ncbi:tyrosine-protein kinase receptor Tie-1-like [Patiria miniata]|uniref:receptor protein-tyrosine kinase n=1 Tax=Patiria miniata TaxID=46514 RepID=A0A914ASC1_PATMI|nr:tyrosine-protein kinase receptor Tie-1-like [Patiria miniata]
MVTPTPYGAGSAQSSASISCFRSSPDADVTLSFGRPFQIGLGGSTIQTSTTLPTGSTPSVNGQIVTQDLTTSIDATGLFYCEGSNRGLTTRVYSIIHSVNRRFEPVDGLVTKTINKEEDVTLSVITVNSGGSPLWHRIRNGTVTSNFPNFNQASFTLPSTDAVDGDLYTVVGSVVTLTDNHFSMIRLIVRGCAAGKWGPPDCAGVCDLCYIGGVCNDETGDCICPPGFSGPNCLTACGMHRFGWECEFQCGPGNSIQSCVGSQFGLPDPYGNSCISGYCGRDCNVVCPSGTFGAGCTQTCRCQAVGAACDRFTGACTPSGCQAGWSGTSCQISGTCPPGKFGLDCLSDCHCANNAACERDSGYCSESNGVCADGFKSDMNANNCQTGIIEFQMLAMPNQGQDVAFSCAATSGDTLSADSIVVASGSSSFPRTGTVTEGMVLNNTFTGSGLINNQLVVCYLTHNSQSVLTTLSASFFVPPSLSQSPAVVAGPGSVTVSWQAWDSHMNDFGDGPIIRYIINYMSSTSASWTMADEIPVTDQSQAAYSFVVQPLEPSTQYQFSVAAVRDGPGGQGPFSPASQSIYPLTPPPPTTPPPTTEGPTVAESSTLPAPPITTLPAPTASVVVTGSSSTITPQPTPADESNTVLIAVIVVAVIVVIVVAVVLCIYCMRRRRSRRQPAKPTSAGVQEMTAYENQISPDNGTGASDYERVGHDHPTSYEVVGINMSPPTYEDVGLPSWTQRWSVPWEEMMVGKKVLGEGNFGEVRDGAVLVGEDISKAAIKTLKANASENDRQNFMEEFRTLTKVGRHPNVVSILGACQHEDILYVALEFMPNGDLRTYLRNARSLGDDDQSTVSPEKLIQFALDVAKGMQHLDAVGVIHRDLAARNILLDSQLVAKVSDFGLSGGEDIYVQMSRTRVPTRWLSLESLTSKTYTSKSDVWSFGILLWEIATLGATPYEDTKSKDLLSRLKSGYRMPKPSSCDDKFYNLMLLCWQEDPAHRPHFKKLVTRLTSMGDSQNEHTYMRLLPKADNYMYLMIRPELDDN